MHYYFLVIYLLVSCSTNGDTHTPSIQENNALEEKPETSSQTQVETESSSEPEHFFNPLLNENFSNCFSSGQILSSDFEEGLEVYKLKNSVILSPGKGLITNVAAGYVQSQMTYVENGRICTYTLSIHHINSSLEKGDTIWVGDTLGHAKTEDNSYTISVDSWTDSKVNPGKWELNKLAAHKDFMIPSEVKNLIIVDKENYHFWYYLKGDLKHDFPIALGQDPKGHKMQQGDNKTPEGLYTIVEKMKGPFNSPTGPWLGNSWFRLNYPNKWDAEKGYENGLITKAQRDAIVRAFNANRDTPNNTKLGGHIGIHGWNGDWYEYSTHDVTWGCVSMRNHQIDEIYDEIPVGTKVFILP